MTSQKTLDILLLILSVYGIYSYSQSFGILMGFWAVMFLPLAASVLFSKKSPAWLWAVLFVFGVFALLVKMVEILKLNVTQPDLVSDGIVVWLPFMVATILFLYKAFTNQGKTLVFLFLASTTVIIMADLGRFVFWKLKDTALFAGHEIFLAVLVTAVFSPVSVMLLVWDWQGVIKEEVKR